MVFGSAIYNDSIRHLGTNPLTLRRSAAAVVSSTGTNNVWKHLVLSHDSTTGQVTLYENGAAGTPVTYRADGTVWLVLWVWRQCLDRAPDANVDEMRISSTTLSAAWISTEHNNQNSPGSSYHVGAETPKP